MLNVKASGGFRLGPGAQAPPPNLAQQLPQFLIAFIVILLSRCCLPNDEGPDSPKYFFLEPPLVKAIDNSLRGHCTDERRVRKWDKKVRIDVI